MTRLAARLADAPGCVFPCRVAAPSPRVRPLGRCQSPRRCFASTVQRTHSTPRSLPTAQSPLRHSNSSSRPCALTRPTARARAPGRADACCPLLLRIGRGCLLLSQTHNTALLNTFIIL
ncbi:Hypothetical protein SMAX5B_018484 [Scophthalmus maximus]|uniref:Uncharacterized protein n=1 Tax=Scophthalmus maximus TaxID=52904 RepID=A0A2U9C9U0_SCOMX|nr:Hypothetical protein SMAX5B_018484 [Scophthalmus maximus]